MTSWHDDIGNVIGQRHPTRDIMVSATSSNRRQQHALASSTAVLILSNKLICFNKQIDLLIIQHLLEIIPGMMTMAPGDR